MTRRRRPLLRSHAEDVEPVPADQQRRLCALSMAQAGGHELALIGTPRMVWVRNLIEQGVWSDDSSAAPDAEEQGR